MPHPCQAGTPLPTQVKLMTELNSQLRRATLINVPHYEAASDQFVFDDGRRVNNNDPAFNKFKWA
jgi:hypothetical protein